MIKKILLLALAITTFFMLFSNTFAVIQLDPSLRPGNLPDVVAPVTEIPDGTNPETLATQSVILFVGKIVSRVLVYAGVIAVVFFIVAGANYILAFGKDERIEKGKRGIYWTVMGMLVILFSYAIVQGVITLLLQVDVAAT